MEVRITTTHRREFRYLKTRKKFDAEFSRFIFGAAIKKSDIWKQMWIALLIEISSEEFSGLRYENRVHSTQLIGSFNKSVKL